MRSRMLLVPCAALLLAAGCSADGPDAGSPAAPRMLLTLVDVAPTVEVTAGGTGTWNWAGQSVTIPAGGTFTSLRFNWYLYSQQAGQPTAFGRLYILDREYLGLPGGLGPATEGFVGRSDRIENNEYVFASDVRLSGGRKYWFYTDTQGAWSGSFDTDIYPGGDKYVSGHPSAAFRKSQASGRMVNGVFVPGPPGVFTDANFKLQASVE
jgi:hypothetical protein